MLVFASVHIAWVLDSQSPINIVTTASSVSPLKGELPITKVFKVDHISAARHEKFGGGSVSMRVSYYCGVKMYTEYVVFENTNPFVTRRAKAWWKLRMHNAASKIPLTVNEALTRLEEIKHPTHIRVWVNKSPYPRIHGHLFGVALPSGQMSVGLPAIVSSGTLPVNQDPGDGLSHSNRSKLIAFQQSRDWKGRTQDGTGIK